jgi:hypothetical protein
MCLQFVSRQPSDSLLLMALQSGECDAVRKLRIEHMRHGTWRVAGYLEVTDYIRVAEHPSRSWCQLPKKRVFGRDPLLQWAS